jgi:DNA-binding IclR family transcriptional regulator
MGNDTGELDSTKTSLEILDTLMDLEGARVSEVADHLDVPKSTVHVHLKTLHRQQYVEKEGDIYQVGLKLFSLGAFARRRNPIHVNAMETVDELSSTFGEDADFAVPRDGQILVLYDEFYEKPQPGFQTGKYYHMHNTAAGKSMLAEFSEDAVDAVVDQWGLPDEGQDTITTREELDAELALTRERGYAIHDDEAHVGILSVGVAVTDSLGQVAGAFTVYGPKYRFPGPEDVADEFLEIVSQFEDDIQQKSLY